MKKTNKILSIIALLLVTVMAFAACASNDTPAPAPTPSTPNTDATTTNTPDPYTAKNYSTLLAEWTKYFEYKAPDKTPTLGATEMYQTTEGEIVTLNGGFLITSLTKDVTEMIYPELSAPDAEAGLPAPEPYELKLATTVNYNVYNAATGEKILSYETLVPEFDSVTDKVVSERYSISDYGAFGINTKIIDGLEDLIEISKSTLVLKEGVGPEEATGEAVDPNAPAADPYEYLKLRSNYEVKTVYSYYYTDGTALATDLETRAEARLPRNESALGHQFLLDIDNKTLVLNEKAETIRTFDLGKEYDIPHFNEDSRTVNLSTYTFFTVGENYYLIREAEGQVVTQIGDFNFGVVPSMSVQVMDKSFKTVATYETNCYHVSGYAVMANGNIYVCEYRLLPNDAAEYDFKFGEEKIDAVNTIINVADGSIKNVELPFVASRLLNNITKDIKSNASALALNVDNRGNNLLDNTVIKGNYMIAEIQKYSNKELSADTVFAVLDENLTVVAELPAIFPNQFGYIGFLDSDDVIISTDKNRAANAVNDNNNRRNYTVNTKTGKAQLYTHLTANAINITNGYYFDKKMYDENWKIIKDFEKDFDTFEFVKVVNGRVYYTVEESLWENEELGYVTTKTLYYAVISDANAFESHIIVYDFYGFSANGDFIITMKNDIKSYRNISGEILIKERFSDETDWFSGDQYTTSYKIEATDEVADGVYIVRCKYTYTRGFVGESGWTTATTTCNEYYIIK